MSFSSLRTLSLVSSCLFLFGVLLSLIDWMGWIGTDPSSTDDRELAAILHIVAWAVVSASVLPELAIDISGIARLPDESSEQAFFHGRYGTRPSIFLSLVQTLLFLGGTSTMGMVMKRTWDDDFSYESDLFREKDYLVPWKYMLFLSSILMTISGILAVISSGCCCCGRSGRGTGRRNKSLVLVQTSNIMFLSGAGLLLFAAATDKFACMGCFLGYFLIMIAYALWSACGVLWIVADALLPIRDEDKQEQQPSDAELSEVDPDAGVPEARAVTNVY